MRLCIENYVLSKMTISIKYPLSKFLDLFDQLHGARVFSKIAICSGYHRLRVREVDVSKIDFATCHVLYAIFIMSFGLTNIPSVFMTSINGIFRPLLVWCFTMFIDDIMLYSSSLDDHIEYLRTVLQTLQEHKLYAKFETCEFWLDAVKFLVVLCLVHAFWLILQKLKQ